MKKLVKVLVLVLAISTVMAGCSQNAQPATSTPGTTNTASANPDNYFGKYPEPVTVTMAVSTNAAQVFENGDDYGNNIWTRSFQEDMNLNIKISWEALGANNDYQQKMSLQIVSGDLPDIFLCDYSQMSLLSDAGRLMPLDDVYAQYAYPFVKQCYEADGGLTKSWGTLNGKMMGVSLGGVSYQSARMILLRDDWFKQTGLAEPKTMEDVLAIAKKEVEQHPGSYALPLNKKLIEDGGMADIVGMANAMGVYPDLWLDDGTGKLIYGTIQPGMKNVLQVYADLYKDNLLDPAFATIDGTKVGEEMTSDKIGVIIGDSWLPSWPLNTLYQNEGVDWDIYPLMASTTNTGKLQVQTNANASVNFVCVNAKAQHPEALFKIINYQTSKLNDPALADTDKYRPEGHDHQGETPLYIFMSSPTVNEDTATHITQAIDTGDESVLVQPQDKMDYPVVKQYLQDVKDGKKPDQSAWVKAKGWYGPKSAFGVLNQYIKDDSYITNKVVGYQSPTMINNWSSLQDLEEQYFAEIIANKKPISAFDQFVSDWKAQGGDTITQEVNDWYASNKG